MFVILVIMKKIFGWIVDYYFMLRSWIPMVVHSDPPKHYLNYIVSGKVPVIIIPGILMRWGSMKKIADKISLTGHPVYVINDLKYNLFDIPTSARIVRASVIHALPGLGHIIPNLPSGAEKISELVNKHNLRDVVLVAHSKGGLIGKYVLAHNNNDNRFKGMVAIAAPFHGSALAKLIPRHSFKELREDSKIILDLEEHTDINHKIISIYPEFDNHVWSEKSSHLENARENCQINIHGHHKVLFDKQVIDKVLRSIEIISKI